MSQIKTGRAVSTDSKQIATAIARLPGQSNAAVARVLQNARAQVAQELVHACEAELAMRGSLQLSEEEALQVVAAQMKVKDKSLREVIQAAFQDLPPFNAEEAWVLTELAGNPGIRYADLETAYAARFDKKDLSLVVGHLVHNRFGYFRHLIQGTIQSDLLIVRDNDGGTTYRLRAEALEALRALKLVPEGA